MSLIVLVLGALIAGACIASQGAINSELSRSIGQARAVAFSILISLFTISVVVLIRPGDGSFAALGSAPRWALIGGVLGVVVLLVTIIAVPRIGVAATTGGIVAGQVIASAIIDRFGLLGVAMRPLTVGRLTGLALLVLAVTLVTRG
jgi:bacterial/archaeal transporter family-2 protein